MGVSLLSLDPMRLKLGTPTVLPAMSYNYIIL